MIFAVCVACGGYLDRNESICRACGADNAPDAEDAGPIEFDSSLVLDRLGEWSLIKHEIVSKYASAYARIPATQQSIKRFVYADGFAGSGVALDGATATSCQAARCGH
jgi:ribosomal protein L40E